MLHSVPRPSPRSAARRLLAAVGVLAAGSVASTFLVAGSQAAVVSDAVIAAAPQPDRSSGWRGKEAVMVVGNNWEGTATLVHAVKRKALATIDMIPDIEDELAEIFSSPDRLGFYLAIQQAVGEGHDQYVDDMFIDPTGRYLAASRPSLADVVWIDVRRAIQGKPNSIVAEAQMDGYRTDHMAVSPDGRRLLVSDSTERQVLEFSMVDEILTDGSVLKRGDRLRSFATGDTPHESNYFKDGKRILHASIGRVYTPGDYGYIGPVDANTVSDSVKADRWLQVNRTRDFAVTRRWDMGLELAEAGYPEVESSAVRPVVITPNEKILYAQVSFLHGLVEFKLNKRDPNGGGDYTLEGEDEPNRGLVSRVINLPISDEAAALTREQYVLDSAMHGLAISENGKKLCVSGTMSDYAAIVDRATFTPKIISGATKYLSGRSYSKPYWATHGPRNTCWMSMSGGDFVSVINFRTEKVVAEVPVGDHPQRVREAKIKKRILALR